MHIRLLLSLISILPTKHTVAAGALPVTLDRARSEKGSLQFHFSDVGLRALECVTFHVELFFALCGFRACRSSLGRLRARIGFGNRAAITWTYSRITGQVEQYFTCPVSAFIRSWRDVYSS
jgi:hypothetical protein